MTDNNLAKFYTGPASILQDHRVLTAVSTFLQSTKEDIIEALHLRRSPITQVEGKTTGEGYLHYPKKERRKSRYITEPLPLLRDIQEKMLFMLENIEQRTENMKKELKVYANWQGHNISSAFAYEKTAGILFDEGPIEKTVIHRDAHESNPYFMKIDIAHAYKSLSEDRLFLKLQEILKDQYELAPFNSLTPLEIQKATAILTHMLTYKNYLATGAPTSPFLFHKSLEGTDRDIIHVLGSMPIEKPTYTRYLDDIIITFSLIHTPTSAEIVGHYRALLHIYESLGEKDTIDVIAQLSERLRNIQRFFRGTEILVSDTYSKKHTREQLSKLREFLEYFKELFEKRPESVLENLIMITDSELSDEEYITLFQKMLTSIGHLSTSFSKQIHYTIGLLDQFKRRLDKSELNSQISLPFIKEEITNILLKSGWPINKEKTITRFPHSPSMHTMLGLGINDYNNITIPRKLIAEKISMYLDVLNGKIHVPHHLQHTETGTLNYWAMLTSIQGYKEYILEIKGGDHRITKKEKMQYMRTMEKFFSEKERIGFRKAEKICADHFGITVEEAYDLMFASRSPEKEEAYFKKKGNFSGEFGGFDEDGWPIDIRVIPREDAESNKSEEQDLPFQFGTQDKNNNEFEPPTGNNNGDECDDLPF